MSMGGQPIFDTTATGGVLTPLQKTYITYIVLAIADVFVVTFSILMLIGVDPQKKAHRWYFYPWIVYMFIYIIYESGINIAYFVQAFGTRNNPATPMGFIPPHGSKYGFMIVPLIYWIVKELIIFAFWVVVIAYVRQVIEAKKAAVRETVQVETGFKTQEIPVAVTTGQTCLQTGFTGQTGLGCTACNRGAASGPTTQYVGFRGYNSPGLFQQPISYNNYGSRLGGGCGCSHAGANYYSVLGR